jgi:asparagine synthetase B (glutamine-hydrolysing)
MCGIYFSLSCRGFISPDLRTAQLLKNRGPDSLGTQQLVIPGSSVDASSSEVHATFISTVLSLRGTTLTEQPLKDPITGSILCWNGEAWSVAGQSVLDSDSCAVFNALLASHPPDPARFRQSSIENLVQVLCSIRGPFAFVFYDAKLQCIFYGRDCLGRRSLLRKVAIDDTLVISSVCDNTSGEQWAEIEADGIYVLDLIEAQTSLSTATTHVPHRRRGDELANELHFVGKSFLPRKSLKRQGYSLSHAQPEHQHRNLYYRSRNYTEDQCFPPQVC